MSKTTHLENSDMVSPKEKTKEPTITKTGEEGVCCEREFSLGQV